MLPPLSDQVSSTSGISVGQWVRLYQPSPDNTGRRRLLSAQGGSTAALGRKLRQDNSPVPPAKVSVLGTGGPAPAPAASPAAAPAGSQDRAEANGRTVPQWYSDPAMQAALEAAVKAQWTIADALDQDPNRVRMGKEAPGCKQA